jgi:hypothetical protein
VNMRGECRGTREECDAASRERAAAREASGVGRGIRGIL